MEVYDYIITGGGCAGLSLAARMNASELKNCKVLILDKEPKEQNDKTWCYWAKGNEDFFTPQKSWPNMVFHSDYGTYRQDISPYTYRFIGSMDFYQSVYADLAKNPNFTLKYEQVTDLKSLSKGAEVSTDQGTYRGKWIFNSIPTPFTERKANGIYLKQHFYGWFLKMEEDTFSPSEMTLMDFRMEQRDAACFVYVLPFDKRKALVEFTVFSEETWEEEDYETELQVYLDKYFPQKHFRILQKEKGVIPMTNHSFPRKKGKHIMNIGTAGGFTKPTTGYTFKKIQEDTRAIVNALIRDGNPDYFIRKKSRFSFYDNLLLYLIQSKGGMVHGIFDRLFEKNDFRTLINFLDEKTGFFQEMWILLRLPWAPFLKAILDYYILKIPAQPLHTQLRSPKPSIDEPTIA